MLNMELNLKIKIKNKIKNTWNICNDMIIILKILYYSKKTSGF